MTAFTTYLLQHVGAYVTFWCVISFLLGSLPFGLWIGLLKGVDIRTLGSKNIGATNVLRVLGPGPGAVSFILDVLKGAAGALLARALWPEVYAPLSMTWLVLIGLCAVLGHTFSPFLRFKGGKGIASSLGVLIALAWPVAVVGLSTWIIVVAITRYVSLASIAAALSLPFASYFTLHGEARTWMLALSIALFVLATARHKANIRRLLNGTEPKFGQRVTGGEPPSATPEVQ